MTTIKDKPIATIHAHINIWNDTPHEGPVMYHERVEAIRRFLHWHERQVQIGYQLLDQLTKTHDQVPASPAQADTDTHGTAGDIRVSSVRAAETQ